MSAYCHYINAPGPTLDQTNTGRAINELQLFLGRYPESQRRDSCNTLIHNLHVKLEDKAFEISKQYLHTRYYKSAIVAFDNLLKDYPDTRYREEILFLKLRAQYLLASKSILSKQEERYAAIEKQYHDFVDAYKTSKHLREAESIYKNAQTELVRLQTYVPETYIDRAKYRDAIKLLNTKLKQPKNEHTEYQTFLLHKALYLRAIQGKKEERETRSVQALGRFDELAGQVQNPKWLKQMGKYRKNLESRQAVVEEEPAESSSK